MNAIDQVRRLFAHMNWADTRLIGALRAAPAAAEAWREYRHILGAERIWLERLEERAPNPEVWPTLTPADAEAMRERVAKGYDAFIARLNDQALTRSAAYKNTKGQAFETPIGEILLHVALHGQYHRGKVNLLLRQGGAEPAPTDFIAFVRGVPAARS